MAIDRGPYGISYVALSKMNMRETLLFQQYVRQWKGAKLMLDSRNTTPVVALHFRDKLDHFVLEMNAKYDPMHGGK